MLFMIGSFIVSISVIYSTFSHFYYERKLIEIHKIKYDLKKYLQWNMNELYDICDQLERLLLKNSYNNDAKQVISIRTRIDNFYDNVYFN